MNGEIEMTTWTEPSAAAEGKLPELISGWHFRGTETRAMQSDDFDNPGMIFVEDAMEDWYTPTGDAGKSCASCHDDAADSMKGVRAVYPKWNEDAEEVRTLEMQVNACRTENMEAEPLGYTSTEMTSMVALISSVSRGMPVDVATDGPVSEIWEAGKELYYTRFGQLELSCANCHEDNYGRMIRADHLSQGHVNGFPVYRSEEHQAECGACPVQGLRARYPRRDIRAGQPRIRGAGALRREPRQRSVGRGTVGPQLKRKPRPASRQAGFFLLKNIQ